MRDFLVQLAEITLAIVEIPYESWYEKVESAFDGRDIHLAHNRFINDRSWIITNEARRGLVLRVVEFTEKHV